MYFSKLYFRQNLAPPNAIIETVELHTTPKTVKLLVETALRKRDATRQHKDAQAERARKVDVRNFVDAETGRLDSQTASMLSGGEYGAKNAADLSRQALQSNR